MAKAPDPAINPAVVAGHGLAREAQQVVSCEQRDPAGTADHLSGRGLSIDVKRENMVWIVEPAPRCCESVRHCAGKERKGESSVHNVEGGGVGCDKSLHNWIVQGKSPAAELPTVPALYRLNCICDGIFVVESDRAI